VALLLASLAFGVAIVEIGWRIARPLAEHPSMGRYQGHAIWNHQFVPDQDLTLEGVHPDLEPFRFQTNSLGLRADREFPTPKPDDVRRMIVMGDSFIEGYEWSRSIPARLQSALAPLVAAAGAELEVINAGAGSFSPMIHYFLLRDRLLALEPDLIVLEIDMTDAFNDTVQYQPLLELDEAGEPVGVGSRMGFVEDLLRDAMSEQLPLFSLDGTIARCSSWLHLCRWSFRDSGLQYLQEHGRLIDDPTIRQIDRVTSDDIYAEGVAEVDAWRDYSEGWIERVLDLAEAHGVPVVLATYPPRPQLRGPPAPDAIERLAALAERRGIPFHSPYEAVWAAKTRGEVLYLPNDMHFNYRGQEVWANDLTAFLAPGVVELLGLD